MTSLASKFGDCEDNYYKIEHAKIKTLSKQTFIHSAVFRFGCSLNKLLVEWFSQIITLF